MTGPGDSKQELQLDIWYNTTHMDEKELKKHQAGAAGQCRAILKFFDDNPEGYFTPFEVQRYANIQGSPIWGIRRAINTLTRAGLLIKTDTMKPGDYGINNHTWKKNN